MCNEIYAAVVMAYDFQLANIYGALVAMTIAASSAASGYFYGAAVVALLSSSSLHAAQSC